MSAANESMSEESDSDISDDDVTNSSVANVQSMVKQDDDEVREVFSAQDEEAEANETTVETVAPDSQIQETFDNVKEPVVKQNQEILKENQEIMKQTCDVEDDFDDDFDGDFEFNLTKKRVILPEVEVNSIKPVDSTKSILEELRKEAENDLALSSGALAQGIIVVSKLLLFVS